MLEAVPSYFDKKMSSTGRFVPNWENTLRLCRRIWATTKQTEMKCSVLGSAISVKNSNTKLSVILVHCFSPLISAVVLFYTVGNLGSCLYSEAQLGFMEWATAKHVRRRVPKTWQPGLTLCTGTAPMVCVFFLVYHIFSCISHSMNARSLEAHLR